MKKDWKKLLATLLIALQLMVLAGCKENENDRISNDEINNIHSEISEAIQDLIEEKKEAVPVTTDYEVIYDELSESEKRIYGYFKDYIGDKVLYVYNDPNAPLDAGSGNFLSDTANLEDFSSSYVFLGRWEINATDFTCLVKNIQSGSNSLARLADIEMNIKLGNIEFLNFCAVTEEDLEDFIKTGNVDDKVIFVEMPFQYVNPNIITKERS